MSVPASQKSFSPCESLEDVGFNVFYYVWHDADCELIFSIIFGPPLILLYDDIQHQPDRLLFHVAVLFNSLSRLHASFKNIFEVGLGGIALVRWQRVNARSTTTQYPPRYFRWIERDEQGSIIQVKSSWICHHGNQSDPSSALKTKRWARRS